MEETDLDPSSSLMSLFIPQNTTEDSNATKNNGTKKHTLADESNSEDFEEINDPKIIVTKISQNKSLSFEDLFTYLFEK